MEWSQMNNSVSKNATEFLLPHSGRVQRTEGLGLGGRSGFRGGFSSGLRGRGRGPGRAVVEAEGLLAVKLKTRSGSLSPSWAAWLRT